MELAKSDLQVPKEIASQEIAPDRYRADGGIESEATEVGMKNLDPMNAASYRKPPLDASRISGPAMRSIPSAPTIISPSKTEKSEPVSSCATVSTVRPEFTADEIMIRKPGNIFPVLRSDRYANKWAYVTAVATAHGPIQEVFLGSGGGTKKMNGVFIP